MCKGLCGLFLGVFVGAVAFEVLRKSELGKQAVGKIAEGLKSTKAAFIEGYRSAVEPASETT